MRACFNLFAKKEIFSLASDFLLNKNIRMPLYPEPKFRGPKRTKSKTPLSRVELHIHLDGSVRLSTIWELYKQKSKCHIYSKDVMLINVVL